MTFICGSAPIRAHHITALCLLGLLPLLAGASGGSDLDRAQKALDEGRYEEAERLARGAAEGPEAAQALNIAGASLLYRGQYAEAMEAFVRSRDLYRERGDMRQDATLQVNIGAIHFYQGRYWEAWECYQSALKTAQENGSATWSPGLRQLAEVNEATLLQRLGRDQEALQIYLRYRGGAGGLSAAEQAQVLSNLGALYRRMGDPYKAVESEKAALALFHKEGNLDGELGAMKNIAIAEALDLNQPREAQALLSQVLALALKSGDRREIMQARLYLGEASYRAGEMQKAAALWEQALSSARELKAPEEEWKALYSLGLIARDKGDMPAARARWTAAAALIEAGRTQLRSSELRQRFLADKRDVYDALIASAPDPEQRLAWLERARSRRMQDKIAAPPPSLSELSGRLPEGTAMLVYWVAASQAGVLWISHSANGWIDIPWSGGSSSRLAAFLRELRSDPTTNWKTGAREWGELLMAKAVQAARAPANLIIVPDGPLTEVPFDALILSGNQLLIERHTTWLAPTTRSLIAEEAPRGWGWPWQRQLLAFGDPAVSAVLPGDQSWQSLPRAAAEIRAAADVLNGRSEVHLGVQAQKAAFLKESPAPIIHLATHAMADLENPARSRILFAAPGGSPAYLFLPEAAALPMRGVELVTLSACETEAGQVVRGEGPLNFSRAFLEAGARSAVSTLWAVSDQSAEFIMSRMYQAMAEREPKAAALRRAKLSAIAKGGAAARPGFWAPYVISGDGGRPLRPFLSWSVLLVLAATALAGIAMLLAIRRAPRAESSPR